MHTFRDLLVPLVHQEGEERAVCLALQANLVIKVKRVKREIGEIEAVKGHREIKEKVVKRYTQFLPS